ncbi:MAG: hypothetical protein WCT22_01825 [Patescibacteria group bacterium]|jgi:hypothetical protein
MDNSNIKMYLAISGALIVLLILIILIPFSSKKTSTQDKTTNPNGQLFPTSVDSNPLKVVNQVTPITIPADFTGVIEEKIPQPIVDLAAQKKDLRSKVPLSLSTFTIDFDYAEDKFTVALKDPKDQAQKEFESWRILNYSLLDSNQFLLK